MKVVSRFEADLLHLLHFLLGRVPPDQGMPLVHAEKQPPPCLSRAAVELVQEGLAKGCMVVLAKRGGWRPERFLRDGRPVEGRLWERTAPAELGLSFSGESLRFLIWLTAAKPKDKKATWPPPGGLTLGDQLLFFLAYEVLRDSSAGPALRTGAVAENAVCRLMYPEDFVGSSAPPDFAPWTTGPGASMLEVLQDDLGERTVALERAKGGVADPRALRSLGEAQGQVFDAFLDAVE